MNCNECGGELEEWESHICEGCGMKKKPTAQEAEKKFADIGKSLANCDARGLPEELSALIRESRRLHGWPQRQIDA